MIYFDNAATTRIKPEEVYQAYNYYIREIGVSPGRGSYSLGIQASRMLYQARKMVAHFFGASKSANVVFTKNSTEAINLYLNGLLKKGDHVLITPYEHNAVFRPINLLKQKGIIDYTVLPEDVIYNHPEKIEEFIQANTKLIVLTLASNLTGQIVFNDRVAEEAQKRDIQVFVDASQGGGKRLIQMNRDHIDAIAFTGHKDLMALPGVGGLCTRKSLDIAPLLQGGTGIFGDSYVNPDIYPDAYEAGTLNMPAIWALKTSLEYIEKNFETISEKEKRLMSLLVDGLRENPEVIIYNPEKKRVSTLCFNLKDVPSNKVVEFLDEQNICVRGGIHCAILAHETIGTVQTGAVRVSLNHFNTEDEVKTFLEVLKRIKCI